MFSLAFFFPQVLVSESLSISRFFNKYKINIKKKIRETFMQRSRILVELSNYWKHQQPTSKLSLLWLLPASLLKVCWSTMKLHTTLSLLRPRAKPFPLRTMSKDSAECKQEGRLDACNCKCLEFPAAPVGNRNAVRRLLGECKKTLLHACACERRKTLCRTGTVQASTLHDCMWFHTRRRRKRQKRAFVSRWHTLFRGVSLCSWTCCIRCMKRFACWLVGWTCRSRLHRCRG